MAPLSETGISRRSLIQTALAGTALATLPHPLRAALPASARDLARLDATAQAALVRAGDVTASDLAEAAIARIEALNPALNAIASKGFEAGRTLARSGPPAGVFSGVPFLIKDLIEFPPLPHMAGSRLMASNVGSFASPYGARVKDAGLVVLGTTTTPEFGLLPTTEPLLTGATRNPWDTDRIAGGSSGGAAAAVASGMVPIAHASDGGGSIRFPAACCGVFGLKPSRGRNVEARREPSPIGVENCFSRSVRDSAAFLHHTQQRGPDAPLTPLPLITAPGTRKLRIGVTVASYTGSLPDADTADAVRAAADMCRAMGHEVEDVTWPFDGPVFVDHFLTLWGLGAAAIAARARAALGPDADLSTVLEPWTLGLAAEYGPRGEAGAAAAFENFRKVADAMAGFFEDYDLLLTPAQSEPAPAIGHMAPTVAFDTLHERVMTFAAYTPWQNAAGTPAMSVPLYQSAGGLPIGIQFSAAMGREDTLLEMAYALEDALPWADRWPAHSAVAL